MRFPPSLLITPLVIIAILAAVAAVLWLGRTRRVYEAQFVSASRERLFLSAIGFFITVAVVRGVTYAIHHQFGPFHDVSLHGRHIHHLVWGILLLLLCGYGWLLQAGRAKLWISRILCLIYGVGAALTLDEFALWLNLRDVYWEREGRSSLEALGLFAALLAIGVYGAPFFHALAREAKRSIHRDKEAAPHSSAGAS